MLRSIYLGGKYTIQLAYSSNESHPPRFYDTPKCKALCILWAMIPVPLFLDGSFST